MRKLLPLFLFCLSVDVIPAAQTIREFRWPALKAAGQVKNGEVMTAGPGTEVDCLMLSNTLARPAPVEILSIDQPGITAPVYALRGRVRYEGVEGTGYLEMWNLFSDGSAYFSRTLATQGPLASLSGSSAWRDMALPFSAAGTEKRPSKLVLNLVLPGRGKVWIGPLTLVQYDEREDPLASSGAWWNDRQGGMIGGIGGLVLGLGGALIGLLSSRGRGRSVVLMLMAAVALLGSAALIAGIVAVLHKQPYGVYYPLLLGGGLGAALFGGLRPAIRRRYAAIELRRMTAADAV